MPDQAFIESISRLETNADPTSLSKPIRVSFSGLQPSLTFVVKCPNAAAWDEIGPLLRNTNEISTKRETAKYHLSAADLCPPDGSKGPLSSLCNSLAGFRLVPSPSLSLGMLVPGTQCSIGEGKLDALRSIIYQARDSVFGTQGPGTSGTSASYSSYSSASSDSSTPEEGREHQERVGIIGGTHKSGSLLTDFNVAPWAHGSGDEATSKYVRLLGLPAEATFFHHYSKLIGLRRALGTSDGAALGGGLAQLMLHELGAKQPAPGGSLPARLMPSSVEQIHGKGGNEENKPRLQLPTEGGFKLNLGFVVGDKAEPPGAQMGVLGLPKLGLNLSRVSSISQQPQLTLPTMKVLRPDVPVVQFQTPPTMDTENEPRAGFGTQQQAPLNTNRQFRLLIYERMLSHIIPVTYLSGRECSLDARVFNNMKRLVVPENILKRRSQSAHGSEEARNPVFLLLDELNAINNRPDKSGGERVVPQRAVLGLNVQLIINLSPSTVPMFINNNTHAECFRRTIDAAREAAQDSAPRPTRYLYFALNDNINEDISPLIFPVLHAILDASFGSRPYLLTHTGSEVYGVDSDTNPNKAVNQVLNNMVDHIERVVREYNAISDIAETLSSASKGGSDLTPELINERLCINDGLDAFKGSAGLPSVLIHCHQGVSRSASLLLFFIMYYYNLSYGVSLALAKTIRPIVAPNVAFAMAVTAAVSLYGVSVNSRRMIDPTKKIREPGDEVPVLVSEDEMKEAEGEAESEHAGKGSSNIPNGAEGLEGTDEENNGSSEGSIMSEMLNEMQKRREEITLQLGTTVFSAGNGGKQHEDKERSKLTSRECLLLLAERLCSHPRDQKIADALKGIDFANPVGTQPHQVHYLYNRAFYHNNEHPTPLQQRKLTDPAGAANGFLLVLSVYNNCDVGLIVFKRPLVFLPLDSRFIYSAARVVLVGRKWRSHYSANPVVVAHQSSSTTDDDSYTYSGSYSGTSGSRSSTDSYSGTSKITSSTTNTRTGAFSKTAGLAGETVENGDAGDSSSSCDYELFLSSDSDPSESDDQEFSPETTLSAGRTMAPGALRDLGSLQSHFRAKRQRKTRFRRARHELEGAPNPSTRPRSDQNIFYNKDDLATSPLYGPVASCLNTQQLNITRFASNINEVVTSYILSHDNVLKAMLLIQAIAEISPKMVLSERRHPGLRPRATFIRHGDSLSDSEEELAWLPSRPPVGHNHSFNRATLDIAVTKFDAHHSPSPATLPVHGEQDFRMRFDHLDLAVSRPHLSLALHGLTSSAVPWYDLLRPWDIFGHYFGERLYAKSAQYPSPQPRSRREVPSPPGAGGLYKHVGRDLRAPVQPSPPPPIREVFDTSHDLRGFVNTLVQPKDLPLSYWVGEICSSTSCVDVPPNTSARFNSTRLLTPGAIRIPSTLLRARHLSNPATIGKLYAHLEDPNDPRCMDPERDSYNCVFYGIPMGGTRGQLDSNSCYFNASGELVLPYYLKVDLLRARYTIIKAVEFLNTLGIWQLAPMTQPQQQGPTPPPTATATAGAGTTQGNTMSTSFPPPCFIPTPKHLVPTVYTSVRDILMTEVFPFPTLQNACSMVFYYINLNTTSPGSPSANINNNQVQHDKKVFNFLVPKNIPLYYINKRQNAIIMQRHSYQPAFNGLDMAPIQYGIGTSIQPFIRYQPPGYRIHLHMDELLNHHRCACGAAGDGATQGVTRQISSRYVGYETHHYFEYSATVAVNSNSTSTMPAHVAEDENTYIPNLWRRYHFAPGSYLSGYYQFLGEEESDNSSDSETSRAAPSGFVQLYEYDPISPPLAQHFTSIGSFDSDDLLPESLFVLKVCPEGGSCTLFLWVGEQFQRPNTVRRRAFMKAEYVSERITKTEIESIGHTFMREFNLKETETKIVIEKDGDESEEFWDFFTNG